MRPFGPRERGGGVATTDRLSVEPALIDWACDRSGIPATQLVEKFRDLPQWRTGAKQPTSRQLQRFAKATFTPFGELFSDVPPSDAIPIGDFRVRGGGLSARPSPHLLETIYICQSRQDWYRDYLIANESPVIQWIGSETLERLPEAAAHDFASVAGFAIQSRASARSWGDALRMVRQSIENAGVLVNVNGIVGNNTRRKLDPDEFSGFALADTYAPVIFVNNADYKAAQMFTLAHEVGHLLLDESGVSRDSVDVEAAPENENWCDRFAAEVLVPQDDLRTRMRAHSIVNGDDVRRLARLYKVSSLVILRRLRTANLIRSSDYRRFIAKERNRYAVRRATQDASHTQGGNFYSTFFQRTGRTFARAVALSTIDGQTTYKDMSRLLGISSMKTFDKIAAEFGLMRE